MCDIPVLLVKSQNLQIYSVKYQIVQNSIINHLYI
jgi:hypothetical protein